MINAYVIADSDMSEDCASKIKIYSAGVLIQDTVNNKAQAKAALSE